MDNIIEIENLVKTYRVGNVTVQALRGVSLAIERVLFAEFREPGWAPAPLLEHLVTAGRLGRKTGKGFREYA